MDINLNKITDQEAAILREMIAASQRIVICAHKSPDGDAIGSSQGWAYYLRSLGKNPVVCVPDMIPDALSWLPGCDGILRYDRHPQQVQQAFDEADLVFCLDFGSVGRLDEMDPVLMGCKARKVVIEYHLAPNLEVDLKISDPHASSASELVFRVIWQLGGFPELDKTWATCVYCGMMTDTGGFTYNSSNPDIYYIICQLLTKGIDKDKIYRNVFNNSRVSAVRFRGHLMSEKLQVIEPLHASYYTVTRKELMQYDFIKGDLEGLVNVPLTIKGHKLSISLREDTDIDNRVLVSLRSVDDFPCNKMAEQFFNGGGHRNASGGKLLCSIEEAEKIAQKAILAFADLLK